MHTLNEATRTETRPVAIGARKRGLTMGDKSPKQQKKNADQQKKTQGAKDQKRKDGAPVSGNPAKAGAAKPKGK